MCARGQRKVCGGDEWLGIYGARPCGRKFYSLNELRVSSWMLPLLAGCICHLRLLLYVLPASPLPTTTTAHICNLSIYYSLCSGAEHWTATYIGRCMSRDSCQELHGNETCITTFFAYIVPCSAAVEWYSVVIELSALERACHWMKLSSTRFPLG